MPKENRTKFAILGMLADRPMSGYDIRKHAAHSIAHFWKEDYGHIYPTLKLLEGEGLATKAEEPAGPGKPARHLYSITDEGREVLSAWLVEMPNPPNLRIELLLKVFFGNGTPPERLASMLETQAEDCAAALGQLRETEKFLLDLVAEGGEAGHAARFQLATLRYGKCYYESFGAWCRKTLDALGESE